MNFIVCICHALKFEALLQTKFWSDLSGRNVSFN